jgi:hypothetical protein
MGPEVAETPDQVVVAFAARPLEAGDYTCPGNPPSAATISLSEPLGTRPLLDGAFYPPKPPTP